MKKKLQQIRLHRRLSQDQVADLVGMTQPNYSRKENGFTKISNEEWELLAKKLQIPVEEIYEEEAKTLINKNKEGNNFFLLQSVSIYQIL